MVSCCAFECFNSSPIHLLYRFPRDQARRRLWGVRVGRDKWTPSNHSKICRVHFEDSMFEWKSDLGQWRLKKDAVPTLFKHKRFKSVRKKPTPRPCKEWELAHEAQIRRRMALMGVKLDHCYSTHQSPVLVSTTKKVDVVVKPAECFNDDIPIAMDIEVDTINILDHPAYQPKPEPNWQQMYLRERQKNVGLMAGLKREKDKSQKVQNKMGTVMGFFNEDQVLFLTRGSISGFSWTAATIKKALQLRFSCGIAGYEGLLHQGFPLPSVRTLQRLSAA
eukprot:maker-scaffold63_size435493-snap-gene-3.28 protein:Tk00834 transcript:maker-scaffold63_size435493-snap-gene-3.28-mRNA-1 annotation:"thap domain-containing protein 4"